ncbi:FAD-dependent monooxygenase [Streptomyces sp. NPDC045431]|uniref:FAD-dependent monooxygenase n=1 Tax=Streptomyces sp. NPDC045431 TaxID=3155613 RepID=UPI0034029206
METVLISGGGIAGAALALLLRRRGFAPVVVERAPDVRAGGQAVDIRGVALEVMDRVGLLAEARSMRTRIRGMSMLDADGTEVERTTEYALSSGRLDSADIEILREDLVRLLHAQTHGEVEYVFGDSIVSLEEHEAGVRVGFAHGSARDVDIVVGADGQHSVVRRLAFGPAEDYTHYLGSYLSVFSADNFLDLDNWQVWLRDGDAGFGIMPVRDSRELRIAFGFESASPLDGDHRDTEWLRRVVVDRLSALHWEPHRLAEAALAAPDFYCDAMAQIRMDRWSHGRMVLLGDAGYCASPFSGQGTSLALVGAYVLADALAQAPGADHRAAFARYESVMRPFVELNQALATENPGGPASEESMVRAKNAITLPGAAAVR